MKNRTKGFAIFAALIAVLAFIIVSVYDNTFFHKGLEYVLYMMGYGDTTANDITQFFLAILGMLLVGVISSFITVNFIEQKSKIKTDKQFTLEIGENNRAYISVRTKRWELYDIDVKLIYSLDGVTYEESGGRFPYWKGKSRTVLEFDLRLTGVEVHSLSSALFGICARAISHKASSLVSSFCSQICSKIARREVRAVLSEQIFVAKRKSPRAILASFQGL